MKTPALRRLMAIALAAVLVALCGPSAAGAQSATPPPGDQAPVRVEFMLRPIDGADLESLGIELDAGQSGELTVVLGNVDTQPLALKTYAADAISNPNGGFGVRPESAPLTPPTTWLDYPPETYELAPGENVERRFSVSVPEGTPPGQYVSGIALETAEPAAVEGTGLFRQVIRKVVPVFITVPGPVAAAAELGEPSFETGDARSRLVIPIENTGNVLLRPAGSLTLRDTTGTAVVTAPIVMRQIYMGHRTTIVVAIPSQVPPGDYQLDLELTDVGTGWTATLEGVPVTLAPPPEPEATPEPIAVEITSASVTPVPDGASGEGPQYAEVTVEITNRADPVRSSRLTLVVARDGEPVEEFVLNENLALLEQTTTVDQRYIPAGGWQAGTYTFSLRLESVDPDSGVEAMLATIELEDVIEVP